MNLTKIKGGTAVDDRGLVKFVNNFSFNGVKRFYHVQNHSKGFIRAWHGHQFEGKYVYVAKGSILIGVAEMLEDLSGLKDAQKFILSSDDTSILEIPPNHANGFMTLTDDAIVLFFSTSSLEESQGDDIRFPYDEQNIWNIERK
jgi:dTDP-4-dehydrorhamnose 3,5-epimerase